MKRTIKVEIVELKKYIGGSVMILDSELKKDGWESYSCFNDYKYVWNNTKLNQCIIAKVELSEDDRLGEVINDVWKNEFLYTGN